MRKLLIILVAALAVVTLSAGATLAGRQTRQPVATGHLFVALESASNVAEVLRYPFVNGFPAKVSDLTYQNVTSPMAVGHDGTLYATVPLVSSFPIGQVDVFPPGSNHLARQITLPNLDQEEFTVASVAEGPGGYLYVGYLAFKSSAREHRPNTDALGAGFSVGAPPMQGILVYAPGANGDGPPVQMFGLPADISGPLALTFDSAGNLYASVESATDLHNRIYTIANPATAPAVVSALDMPGSNNGLGMQFSDAGSHLYVLRYGPRPPQQDIAVYAAGASGHAKPLRAIGLHTSLRLNNGLGIAGPNAYISVHSNPAEVLGFDKHASGSPPPVYTLRFPNQICLQLAIGP